MNIPMFCLPDTGGTSAGGVVGIMFFMILVFAAVGWVGYAYFYPHTVSGQLLIRVSLPLM